jgi:NTP pyrophosphatase (non-canonical NTP hydrolase)
MIDYVKNATRTESVELFKVLHPRLLHAAMGVNTEVAELLLSKPGDKINLKEELGDVLWYAAIVASTFEVTFDELHSLAEIEKVENDPIEELYRSVSETLDHMKKVCFYGKVELDGSLFGRHFGNIIHAVKILGQDEGWELSELQETNIAKLQRRYGDKFSADAAINRNTANELEVMV